ncbi:MAG: TIGR03905 family TSCPD domain-containing protein [Oscillospiraceae bacterium]
MEITYKTKGTCSRAIHLSIEQDVVRSVKFDGGCNGNLKAVSILCKDMQVDEVIRKLKGVTCGFKSTSCPDQLAMALLEYKAKKGD